MRTILRFPLMALGAPALLLGLWGGLARLGWPLPVASATPIQHGPLMVSGFLGTLIGLERAVALGWNGAFVAPLLTGVGVVSLIIGLPHPLGASLMTFGSAALLAVSLVVLRIQPARHGVIMALGVLAWLAGNALWVQAWPIHSLVPLWMGFLILTIVGERLELSRFVLAPGANQWDFWVGVGFLIGGPFMSPLQLDLGVTLMGLGMIIVSRWLLTHDVARRAIRERGQIRFTSVCLVTGFVWLAVGGLLGVLFGGVTTGPRYDALLHAVFLGFVFSMIFGHAPIVLPVLLKRPIVFHPTLYLPLLLLHSSLVLRISCDLGGWWAEGGRGEVIAGNWLTGQKWGGLLNVISILFFLLLMGGSLGNTTDSRNSSVAG